VGPAAEFEKRRKRIQIEFFFFPAANTAENVRGSAPRMTLAKTLALCFSDVT
jgi:hypothetical protein